MSERVVPCSRGESDDSSKIYFVHAERLGVFEQHIPISLFLESQLEHGYHPFMRAIEFCAKKIHWSWGLNPQPSDKCAEGGGKEVFSMSRHLYGSHWPLVGQRGIVLLQIPSHQVHNCAPRSCMSIRAAVHLLPLKALSNQDRLNKWVENKFHYLTAERNMKQTQHIRNI